jgi:2,3-bisphosphoglycerate-independent phosphoglycerate mutase
MNFEMIKPLLKPSDTKIVLLVMDGLGGLPRGLGRTTELEAARTPNLDDLAGEGICGLQQPVHPAVTPGSGPSHLALFGYDPTVYRVGRGVLSALGVDFDLEPEDVAARGNFCTIDAEGRVTDRRAGRISTKKNRALCETLAQIQLDGSRLFVETVKEYRFLLVLRGEGLGGEIGDTDPQKTGVPPLSIESRSDDSERTADLIRRFTTAARDRLAGEDPANMILLRGFGRLPQWPQMIDVFGLRGAAIAGYPMYRGVGRLVGMDILETGASLAAEMQTLRRHWRDFDFFYLHVKAIDSAGEDGDFDRKVGLIEAVDDALPRLLELAPDVLIVTGDHSTPAELGRHSWHTVPVILHSRHCRPDGVSRFGERDCLAGGLGPRYPAVDLLPLALANAGRLRKFGA